MSRWHFDLKSLFVWVTCMAFASAVARWNLIFGSILAIWLTFALLRMSHSIQVLRRRGAGDTWSEFSHCLLASLAAVFLAVLYCFQLFVTWSWTAIPIMMVILFCGGGLRIWVFVALIPAFGYALSAAGRLYFESWLRVPPSPDENAHVDQNPNRLEPPVDASGT
jgi:hypothetical protein